MSVLSEIFNLDHNSREDRRFKKERERSAKREVARADQIAAEARELMEDAKRNGHDALYEKFKDQAERHEILANNIYAMQMHERW